MGYIFLVACAAVALWIAHGAYKIFVYAYLSPYRDLPTPDQGAIWKRLLIEPDTSDFLRWANEVPNDGLIRYFGILNDERLHVTNTQGLAQLLQKDAYLYTKPSAQGQLIRVLAGDNLVVDEGENHKISDTRLQPAFSPARKPHWYQLFSSAALDLVQAIDHQNTSLSSPTTDTTPFNLSRVLSQMGLDTIGKDCVGADFDSLKSPKDKNTLGYLKLFNTSADANLLEVIMHLFPFWLLEALPIKALQYARNMTGQVRETVQEKAAENMAAHDHGQEKEDLDDKNMVDCMRRDLLSPAQVVNNALTMVTAGHEEIGTALTWVVYFLIHHPEVQTRLRNEITSAPGDSSDWKEQGFVEDDFNKIPYLRAVINESLRLRPNVPVIWRESTSPTTLLETSIPRPGAVITASTWAMNRNVDEWGVDATGFNPDRWLDDANGGAKSAFSFMTFGQGPRKCIGELYARTQMECVLAGLVDSFVLSSAHKLEDIVTSQGMITVKVWQGLRILARPVERTV
ncbi:hypothetical protein AUEXF2481DRAFT_71700 [Aureobasidium subglaciale EXF-2481]|uniref:Cytochrome P450 n=1 Tax=Aureobasidium subglaciale (strain EXF-2481) TaxID=1043005 RepID=A0A074YTR5_AURSE|nr:uncharacterized protein AUEXF2481DRAFT_71700 [Aureobasidium subglaciale EXF-2481]KEQ90231.1 hypothetical protein AUEXF2481DRAFT_71700 [Aureobasidium subglaciale EXF-2481]